MKKKEKEKYTSESLELDSKPWIAQSARAVKYTNCISSEE